jgi:hypothetical protein
MERPAYPRKTRFLLTWALVCAIGITLVETLWTWFKSGHFASISGVTTLFLLNGCAGIICGFWIWKWHAPTESAIAERMLGMNTAAQSKEKDRA